MNHEAPGIMNNHTESRAYIVLKKLTSIQMIRNQSPMSSHQDLSTGGFSSFR